ncbi:hypothetical protein Taro_037590 [Colocasia esculenta]|uniref:Transposase n=1 Tax=Colocasia esculenta TaxID=4460 RepID=A0A843W613_COLES|nr:hypothetical protein [Colocasia esculenta]
MTCYIFIYLNRDMVRGGRSRTVSTSVGRGSATPSTTGTASPSAPVVPATGTASPSTPVVHATGTASPPSTRAVPPFPSSSPPEVESQHLVAKEGPQLPGRQPCWISGGKIDPGSASVILTLVHAHIPGPMDAWREFPVPVRDVLFDMFTRRFAFTRPEDLPRARTVWESTAQTNLRKSMWEARDKAMKTTGNWDPMAWLDYGPHHEFERAPTFRELFDRTHKRKGTDDYVSVGARTIAETYDRTMAERYAEGTPQPDLDPEAWVDAAEGPRKGRVYGFGDSLDTALVLSSYASSIASPAYVSSSTAPPVSGVDKIKDLIREELRAQLQTQQTELQTQFDDMVQQLISAIQGVRPTQPAPQVSISINFIYFG